MKHIVYNDNDRKGNVVALPNLRDLQLEELPNLISFCSENNYSTWPDLRKLVLICCPNLAIEAELEANVHSFVEVLYFCPLKRKCLVNQCHLGKVMHITIQLISLPCVQTDNSET